MQVSEGSSLFELGIGLVIVGVVFVVLAVIILGSRRTKKGKTQVAGAVVIGPVPIILGSDKKSMKTVLQLSIVLTTLLIVLTLIYYFLMR